MIQHGSLASEEERHHFPFWQRDDWQELSGAKNFESLTPIALRVLARMPHPVGQVCGPISTGGSGNIEENFKIFQKTIRSLKEKGVALFDQSPFEPKMWEFRERWGREKADVAILEMFYRPVFESGFIKTLYFISGWESSFGSSWEHHEGKRLGFNIVYL